MDPTEKRLRARIRGLVTRTRNQRYALQKAFDHLAFTDQTDTQAYELVEDVLKNPDKKRKWS